MQIVMKFGGSSLQTLERVQDVLALIESTSKRDRIRAVICSAFGGATDNLIEMATMASLRQGQYEQMFLQFKERHEHVYTGLIRAHESEDVIGENAFELHFGKQFQKLKDVLQGVFLVREYSARTLDYIVSFGERLSNQIVATGLQLKGLEARYLDARGIIQTDSQFGSAQVRWEPTKKRILQHWGQGVEVVTGFIASTAKDETTTLGRGGSDFTASLLGAVLDVDEIQIWTDVDGILTADPRKVKHAFPRSAVSFEEAMEMSHFGAKVIYPPTMAPAMSAGIPIRILNTLNPSNMGTLISTESRTAEEAIAGISSIDEVAMLQLKGCGMIGVSGVAARLFKSLSKVGINVIMISQASSEHAICAVIPPNYSEMAKQIVDDEFELEIGAGRVEPARIQERLSVVAVVGEQMRRRPGLAGQVFSALGKDSINVSAIAQGSSERNISFVVDSVDEERALNAIHRRFFETVDPRDESCVQVFLAGPGQVGRSLLGMLNNDDRFDLVAVISRRQMWTGVACGEGPNLDPSQAVPADPSFFLKQIEGGQGPKIFVDCTASEAWAASYGELLQKGVAVVTPNKVAASSEYEVFKQLQANPLFFFEANVGAGLPVLSTLQTLLRSGDRIHSIQAVLSGTLSYLFNHFDGSVPFSRLVQEAHSKGLTEPHPERDLEGLDAGRKILILARLCGFSMELSDVYIENLVPEACRGLQDVSEFHDSLQAFDETFLARYKKAGLNRLRYLANFDGRVAKVGLEEVGPEHPAYHLSGTDNLIMFKTDYYRDTPLVVQGPGAGILVTAAQVRADIEAARLALLGSTFRDQI